MISLQCLISINVKLTMMILLLNIRFIIQIYILRLKLISQKFFKKIDYSHQSFAFSSLSPPDSLYTALSQSQVRLLALFCKT